MYGWKPVWQSQGVWAGVSMLALALLKGAGVQISEDDSLEAQQAAEAVCFGILALWSIYARLRARARIQIALAALVLPVAMLSGCAVNTAALPQGLDQKADELGPQIIVNGNAVIVYGSAKGKLADSISSTNGDTATADGSQQGSTTQGGTQTGGSSGPQDAKADGNLSIPLPVP